MTVLSTFARTLMVLFVPLSIAACTVNVEKNIHQDPYAAERAHDMHKRIRRAVEYCRADPYCWVIEAKWWKDGRICKSASTYYHYFQELRGTGYPMSARRCEIESVVPRDMPLLVLGYRPNGPDPILCEFRNRKLHFSLPRGYADCEQLSERWERRYSGYRYWRW